MSKTATDMQSTESQQSQPRVEKGSPGSQSSDPAKLVPTRRMDFEESMRELPKHFAQDGDLIASHVIMALSSVFPDGEDYFVRTVRHYRDRVSDPALKRQVAGFIGQEAVHGREHRVFNDRLDELGYPTKEYENVTRFGSEDPRAPPAGQVEPGGHRGARALHRHAGRAGADERGDPRPDGRRRGARPVRVARARGVRAQGRRLRRLQGGRRRREAPGLDDELLPLRLRGRHRPGGRAVAAARPRDVPAGRAAQVVEAREGVADRGPRPVAPAEGLQPTRLPPRRQRHHRIGGNLEGGALRGERDVERQADVRKAA